MNAYDAHQVGLCGPSCVVCDHEAATTCRACYDLHSVVVRLDEHGDCPRIETHVCARCLDEWDTVAHGPLCDDCADIVEAEMLALLRCDCTDDVTCGPCADRRLRELAAWEAWAVAEHGSIAAARAAEDRARLDEWLTLGGPWADAARAELEGAQP